MLLDIFSLKIHKKCCICSSQAYVRLLSSQFCFRHLQFDEPMLKSHFSGPSLSSQLLHTCASVRFLWKFQSPECQNDQSMLSSAYKSAKMKLCASVRISQGMKMTLHIHFSTQMKVYSTKGAFFPQQ